MRVTVSAATFLAWVSAVVAQTSGFDAVLTPTKNEVVAAGSTYTITWDYSSTYSSTVSIQILEGASSTTLQLGDVIATGIDNSLGQYSWTVDSSLGDDTTYGIKISYDDNTDIFQYSNPFTISKASSATTSSATTSSATTSSASYSSAAARAEVTSAAAVADNADDSESTASSTIYSTEWLTITSCAASVTDCPARSTVTSSTMKPVVTTVKPSTTAESSAAAVATSATGAGAVPVASQAGSASSAPVSGKPAQASGASNGASSIAAVAVPKTTLSPSYPAGNSTGSGSGSGNYGTVTLPSASTTGSGSSAGSTSASSSSSSSSSSAIAASGAGRVAAGSFALAAGLMAAVLAL